MTTILRCRRNAAASRLAPVPATQPKSRAVPPPDVAEWVERARQLPDVRWDKVQALRVAIASGRYDLEGRLDQLIDRVPQELAEALGA